MEIRLRRFRGGFSWVFFFFGGEGRGGHFFVMINWVSIPSSVLTEGILLLGPGSPMHEHTGPRCYSHGKKEKNKEQLF